MCKQPSSVSLAVTTRGQKDGQTGGQMSQGARQLSQRLWAFHSSHDTKDVSVVSCSYMTLSLIHQTCGCVYTHRELSRIPQSGRKEGEGENM